MGRLLNLLVNHERGVQGVQPTVGGFVSIDLRQLEQRCTLTSSLKLVWSQPPDRLSPVCHSGRQCYSQLCSQSPELPHYQAGITSTSLRAVFYKALLLGR